MGNPNKLYDFITAASTRADRQLNRDGAGKGFGGDQTRGYQQRRSLLPRDKQVLRQTTAPALSVLKSEQPAAELQKERERGHANASSSRRDLRSVLAHCSSHFRFSALI